MSARVCRSAKNGFMLAEVFRGKWVWLVLLGRRSKAMMIATVSALPLIIVGAGVRRPTGTP